MHNKTSGNVVLPCTEEVLVTSKVAAASQRPIWSPNMESDNLAASLRRVDALGVSLVGINTIGLHLSEIGRVHV